METKTRMDEGRRRSLVSLTVCGLHLLAYFNKELKTSQEACQVETVHFVLSLSTQECLKFKINSKFRYLFHYFKY